jgi:hypothetical protein
MPVNDNVSPFFALPLELREEIYKTVLSSPNHGSDMLRTCHEIRGEAQKFLYQKPLIFRSQDRLHTWIKNTPRGQLAHVSEISLHAQDVDLKPILSKASTKSQFVPSLHLFTSGLYQAEVSKITQSLESLPKLKAITIRALSIQSSFLYRGFLTSILNALSTSCPQLLSLCLEGSFHHQELHFLSALRHLESFSFDGFSASSPAATVQILANLHSLRNLSLFSEHALLAPISGALGGFTAKRQSFTGEVVRTIRHLTSLSVTEHIPTTSPTLFFTSEVLGSLHNHKTLKSLSINLLHHPDKAILDSLEDFLQITPIENLELDWPDLGPDTLEHYRLLNGSLKVLWVRAKNMANAFEMLWSIVNSREEEGLSQLRKVVIVRSTGYLGYMKNRAIVRKDSHTEMTDPSTYNVSCNPYSYSSLLRPP